MTKRANCKCALDGAPSDLFGEYLYSLIKTNIHSLSKKFRSIVSEQDKDDLTQEIWLQMQDKKDQYEEGNNFKGWVYVCCRNHFYSFARQRVRKLAKEKDIDYAWEAFDSNPSPIRTLISKETERHIWNEIRQLNPYQKALADMLIEDMKYSKMAHILDCSENTLRGRIFRLRKSLKVAI